ncbi:glycosyltransferase [Chitinophaga nivalis]|uniref:Glycosyl transferase n=1 Tax=Chitinophaga nivalis TaxID=2991709 RepID=A0ABT3IPJ3_9BACT|nr:nucleotide disphospho-sugar-binding domain-containing protein [Chitinophaga nivalis]MCW3464498.1 hypothetical protein [Chitinophaga nivalis]MCW3485811.1 hypothetical protein [Chitinophaga nivalis]
MKRTIVFILSPYISHIIAAVKVARHLQQRGFHIVYVSSPLLQTAIHRYGFDCHPTSVKFIGHTGQDPVVIKILLEEIKAQYAPVAFMVEVGFWEAALLLKGMGIRFLMLQSWAYGDRCAYMPPFYRHKKLPSRNIPVFVWNTVVWEWSNLYHRFLQRGFWQRYRAVVQLSNLPASVRHVTFKNRSTICRVLHVPELVLYPAELDFPRKLHPDTRFAGPFIDADRTENAFDFEQIDLSKPLVVCSLGSLTHWYEQAPLFYQKVIDAFRICTQYTLVMNVGHCIEQFKDTVLPANVHLYRAIPQLTLLKKARFFITHGGASSLKEGIHFAVPMLVYPWTLKSDMYENAKRIVYHQLGIAGDIEQDSPADIVRHLEALCQDRITTGIRYMQSIFEQYQTAESTVIDFIESVIHH